VYNVRAVWLGRTYGGRPLSGGARQPPPAEVVESVYAGDSKPPAFGHVGSNPTLGTSVGVAKLANAQA
jgi:hypothetical protein